MSWSQRGGEIRAGPVKAQRNALREKVHVKVREKLHKAGYSYALSKIFVTF